MIGAFTQALAQLGDPRILRVLLKSLAITLLLFIALGWGLVRLFTDGDPCALIGFNDCGLDATASWILAAGGTALAIWLLFPVVAMGVIAAFSDEIVAAVEARHYPAAAATAHAPGWGEAILFGLASAGRLLLWNLIALPFYILLLITGIGPLLLFFIVNALALGHDLGAMVAMRHIDRAGRRAWLAASRGERAVLGGVTAGLFLVPVINLLAPVMGAAMATHIFHGTRA